MTVRFLDEAADEAEEAYRHYESRQSGLGDAFKVSLALAIARIEARPLSQPFITPPTRKCRLARFPYNLIYRVFDEEILVVAVAHDRRRPNYWISRSDE